MIKSSTLSLVLLLAVLTNGYAQEQQNPQLIFNQATQQLEQGNLQQALAAYHTLEAQNQISGALFMNMGLSYVQIDSLGKAKYYFLKASRFSETDDRAQEAIDYVESRFSRQSAVLPTLPWQSAINWINNQIGATWLLAVGIVLFNAGIFFYIIPWFMARNFSYTPKIALAVALTGAIIIGLSFYIDYRADRYQHAVMVTAEATVTEEPAATATVVNEAFEGFEFTVDQRKSRDHRGWSYIRMSNGQYGWIPTKEIMIL